MSLRNSRSLCTDRGENNTAAFSAMLLFIIKQQQETDPARVFVEQKIRNSNFKINRVIVSTYFQLQLIPRHFKQELFSQPVRVKQPYYNNYCPGFYPAGYIKTTG